MPSEEKKLEKKKAPAILQILREKKNPNNMYTDICSRSNFPKQDIKNIKACLEQCQILRIFMS